MHGISATPTCRSLGLHTLLPAAWFCLYLTAPAQTWHRPQADRRLILTIEQDAPDHADTGHARLYNLATGPDPARLDLITADGTALGYDILWQAEGDPTDIVFRRPAGVTRLFVYAASTNTPPAWTRRAGLVMETRDYNPDKAGDWKDPRTLWARPGVLIGRSLVSEIHHGYHPHGPASRFMARYEGYLDITAAGAYEFATMSDDASFLLINNQVLAAWPGSHGVHGGRRARYRGKVRLKAGRHKLEYYNVQDADSFSVSAAWRPPGNKHFEIIPETAFAAVARFAPAAKEAGPGTTPGPAFTWQMAGHAMVDDLAFVSVDLEALAPPEAAVCTWTFDDGTQARGKTVRHVFFRPGLRRIRMTLSGSEGPAGDCSHVVRVHPRWGQRHHWPASTFKQQRQALFERDLSQMPVSDLAYVVALAGRIEDRPLLTHVGAACLRRAASFAPDHVQALYRLGFHFQHPDVRRYAEAEQALRLAARLAPAHSRVAAQATLHLAGFLIHAREQAAPAQALLDGLDESALSPEDVRLKTIFRGDALLCRGHASAARQTYAAAGVSEDARSIEHHLKRRARLETAKAYVDSRHFDAAEPLIRAIEWEFPEERMNTETGLVMIDINLGREEYAFAAAHCRRLLHGAPLDAHRPVILLKLTRATLALGHMDQAHKTLNALLEEHPFSEAAARAKDLWPSGLPLKTP